MGKKEKAPKTPMTPMEKAINQVRTAWILAFVSAGLTAIIAIFSAAGMSLIESIDIFALIDVMLIIVLAVLIMTLKSRTAAIILLIYYLFSQISMRIADPSLMTSGLFMFIIFTAGYFNGILGTFSYHKLKKAEKDNVTSETDDSINDQNNTVG